LLSAPKTLQSELLFMFITVSDIRH
jgi:hypothetical protein